jgi:hypothetical protein
MNAQGISVFYGASHPQVALAEVRPPVGSSVAIAKFEIVRKLRVLDLSALRMIKVGGSIFDPKTADLLGRSEFLRSLCSRITMPVMPDDEAFEYLVTQAIADFLSTEHTSPLDGMIFPSVQVSGSSKNIVLFQKAARVEELKIPKGAKISVQTGHWTEDGYEREFNVFEEAPRSDTLGENLDGFPNPRSMFHSELDAAHVHDGDLRKVTLRVLPNKVTVHDVTRVKFDTTEFPVFRYPLLKGRTRL